MIVKSLLLFVSIGVILAENLDPNFHDRLQKIRENIEQLIQENKQLKSVLRSLEEKVRTNRKQRITSEKRYLPNLIGQGFTAGVSRTLTNIGSQQRIVFDKFVSGNPDGYDTRTGIFTAPFSGVYVFQVAMLVDEGYEADLHIIKSQSSGFVQDVSALYADARFLASSASSSRTIVLTLNRQDQIFVRNGFTSTIELHGNQFTTFSGWLLYEI